MTARDCLVTLAALFAPDRAALLGRVDGAGAGALAGRAALLAAASRRERLCALAAALGDPVARRARAAAAAAPERPRVAAVLRRLAEGLADEETVSPVLRRLCRERLEG